MKKKSRRVCCTFIAALLIAGGLSTLITGGFGAEPDPVAASHMDVLPILIAREN